MVRKFLKWPAKKRREAFSFTPAPDVTSRVKKLVQTCNLSYIETNRIFCLSSTGSRSRAYARMWGLSRIWQETLKTQPAYILEVTHRFSRLTQEQQDRVLLHELAHVPKNFSGALVGHNGIGKRVAEMIKTLSGK